MIDPVRPFEVLIKKNLAPREKGKRRNNHETSNRWKKVRHGKGDTDRG